MEQGIELELESTAALLPRCLSIDLEVQPSSGKIISFAAVRGVSREAFVFRQGRLTDALARLDDFAETTEFLLGHNIIAFDLPHLEAAAGDLKLLRKPAIDTLWLNPLAFAKSPYHHLVKHYQDGRLQGGHLSDPELDACLVLDLVQDQATAIGALDRRNPDLAAAFHWLTTAGAHEEGFDAFFRAVRRQERPKADSARSAIGRLLEGAACVQSGAGPFRTSWSAGW